MDTSSSIKKIQFVCNGGKYRETRYYDQLFIIIIKTIKITVKGSEHTSLFRPKDSSSATVICNRIISGSIKSIQHFTVDLQILLDKLRHYGIRGLVHMVP